jgi:hypothetical protein
MYIELSIPEKARPPCHEVSLPLDQRLEFVAYDLRVVVLLHAEPELGEGVVRL